MDRNNILPKNYYITSGIGKDVDKLVAFDNALISANISNFNLVKISSILPPNCTKTNFVRSQLGSPLLTAYGTISSNISGTTISSAIAIGIPKSETDIGVIMESSGFESAKITEERVRNMVKKAMKNHKIDCVDIVSSSVECVVDENGIYSTCISAVVLF